MKIKLGFSTCPNDTFMFDALVHGRIPTEDLEFEPHLADIFHLNQLAMKEELDMVKVSYNTYGHLRDTYQLLDSGSALGHNCGPLLISKDDISVAEIIEKNLPVGIPGANTTANLLLGYFAPQLTHKKEYIFHEIMPALVSGEIAAGVIIHENRFTYQNHGLRLIQDLGEYWEAQTSLPIPLGAILAHKRLGAARIAHLNELMRQSVVHAFKHPTDSQAYVRSHAQEMEDTVMKAHIDLYVNQYSVELGPVGKQAVATLLDTGKKMGLYAQTNYS
ncbi:MAG: 1,4-dihydroxy-6-naphthoate synthase [Bacteroidota bacterium]